MQGNGLMHVVISDNTANPAPLGFIGMGMILVLFNFYTMGIVQLGSVIVATAVTLGGFAQILAGLMEWRKNCIFGTTIFIAYGLCSISIVILHFLPELGIIEDTKENVSLALFLLVWGVFSAGIYICSKIAGNNFQMVFGGLTIYFLLLSLGYLFTSLIIIAIGGLIGFLVGILAFYTGIASLINEVHGHEILQLCPLKKF